MGVGWGGMACPRVSVSRIVFSSKTARRGLPPPPQPLNQTWQEAMSLEYLQWKEVLELSHIFYPRLPGPLSLNRILGHFLWLSVNVFWESKDLFKFLTSPAIRKANLPQRAPCYTFAIAIQVVQILPCVGMRIFIYDR